MREPQAVAEYLRSRFDANFQDWARGGGSWPMRIGLHPPEPAQRSQAPVESLSWAQRWRDYHGPGTVRFANAKFLTGIHSMPQQLILDGPGDVAAANPDTLATWKRCGQRLVSLQAQFPLADFDRIIRRVTDLTDDDYQRLFQAITWLRDNPTSGMLLRQIPIEGIHTKWLEQHAGLVTSLLGAKGGAPNDGDSSTLGRLHEILGLRRPPSLIQVTVPDPAIRREVAGMRHFAAGASDLNQWSRHPHTVVILENKETGYAITNEHPGVVVLHGQGFDVGVYPRITWVTDAENVIYWGDIDGPGLEFVNDLRAGGVHARTILMDLPTLDTFGHLAVEGSIPRLRELPHLTPSEADLYTTLIDRVGANGPGILLEQERIPWAYAYPLLQQELDR